MKNTTSRRKFLLGIGATAAMLPQAVSSSTPGKAIATDAAKRLTRTSSENSTKQWMAFIETKLKGKASPALIKMINRQIAKV